MSRGEDKAKQWRPWQFRLQSLFIWAIVVGLVLGWLLSVERLREELQTLRLQLTNETDQRKEAELRVDSLGAQLNKIYENGNEEMQRQMRLNLKNALK